tara:strand:+ start:1821 stop:2486 length:666 start_codon:yes stop_codon:yes gene_type:complete
MLRIPEPNEIMDEHAQVLAYEAANFTESNLIFINLLKKICSNFISGSAIDIGCGPADIPIMLLEQNINLKIDALDGSKKMLEIAEKKIFNKQIKDQINFVHKKIPDIELDFSKYNIYISNSLLHHLSNPQHLWKLIRENAKKDSKILIMDLNRPSSTKKVKKLVSLYAKQEAEILKRDFYNSLCASYTINEVKKQLLEANLNELQVDMVSERHWAVFGSII